MKCKFCGADTSVIATRAFRTVFLKRTRKCFNECASFITIEVPIGVVARSRIDRIENGIKLRARTNALRRAVRNNPGIKPQALARKLGISARYTLELQKELK